LTLFAGNATFSVLSISTRRACAEQGLCPDGGCSAAVSRGRTEGMSIVDRVAFPSACVHACGILLTSLKQGTHKETSFLYLTHQQNLGEDLVQLRCVQRSGAPRLNSARIDPLAPPTCDETLRLFSFAVPRCQHHSDMSHLTTAPEKKKKWQ